MANNLSVDGQLIVGGNTSFFGVGPSAQASVVAAVVTTGAVTTGFGFSTTTQANALVTTVNSILAALKTFGLMATT